MTTVVLVPRRHDLGWRDQLWAFVRERWMTETLWPIHEGHHDEGPFNRAAAINRADRAAGEWDVAVIADADTIADTNRVHDTVAIAEFTGNLTIGHDRWNGLNEAGTRKILAGLPQDQWHRYRRLLVSRGLSSCIAVPRAVWDRVGGFDERFVGWGFEDHAFAWSCRLATGKIERVPGDVWHLWHPISVDRVKGAAGYEANRARLAEYETCASIEALDLKRAACAQ